jgi:biopolymer transport protein ExbD
MKLDLGRGKRPRIEMLPLIDIVFLLLVFFIYAMLSMAVHKALPVALPESAAAAIDPGQGIAVTIAKDGSIFIDKQLVTAAILTVTLLRRPEADRKKGVQVFADRGVTYQQLFRVLDRIRQAGISRLSLEAEVKDGS